MITVKNINECWEVAFSALKTYLPPAIKAEILSSKPTPAVLDFIQNGFNSGRCTPEQIRSWAMVNCSDWSDVVLKRKHLPEESTARAVAQNLESQSVVLQKLLEQPPLE